MYCVGDSPLFTYRKYLQTMTFIPITDTEEEKGPYGKNLSICNFYMFWLTIHIESFLKSSMIFHKKNTKYAMIVF